MQPFSAVIDFGENMVASWECRENQDPVPYAGFMSLVGLFLQRGGQSVILSC
jgi:hypothetical protein